MKITDTNGNSVDLRRPPAMICDACCVDPTQWHSAPIAVYCEHAQHAAMWSGAEGLWLVQVITREQFEALPAAFAQRGKPKH